MIEYVKNKIIDKIIQIYSSEEFQSGISKCANDIKDTTIKYSNDIKVGTIKCAKGLKGESKRYIRGVKVEAVETKEAFLILTKYMKKEDITKEEKKIFKSQMIDLLKGFGIVIPLQLIPLPFVSTVLMIGLDHALQKMNIQILPSSFYEPKELLTTEAVKADLKNIK